MKTIGSEKVYNTHDKHNQPSAVVDVQEIFRVRTELNGGDWLKTLEDEWAPGKSKGPNLSVCIGVKGAKVGDILAVDILEIIPEEIGYTGFAGWRNLLSQKIYPNNWDIVTKTVSIKQGKILWSSQLHLPVIPMSGTLGTAPAGEAVSNYYAGPHGGNMDIQEVCAGTTVYLPVNVDGALLHIGDMHAIMGDGEINHGGGIECRGTVTLRVRLLHEQKQHHWIRLENNQYIMAAACLPDLSEAFYQATQELIHYMCEDYDFSPPEAYLLLGQVLEARATLILAENDAPKSYLCKIAKKYLRPDPDFRSRNILL